MIFGLIKNGTDYHPFFEHEFQVEESSRARAVVTCLPKIGFSGYAKENLTPAEFVTRWDNNRSEATTRTAWPAELAGALQSVSSSVEESISYITTMNQPEIHFPRGLNLGCSSGDPLHVDVTWMQLTEYALERIS